MKRKTPITEAIEKLNSKKMGNNSLNDQNIDEVISFLKTFLPKEKEFAREMFNAGEIKGKERPQGFFMVQQPTFDQLFKQYEQS